MVGLRPGGEADILFLWKMKKWVNQIMDFYIKYGFIHSSIEKVTFHPFHN